MLLSGCTDGERIEEADKPPAERIEEVDKPPAEGVDKVLVNGAVYTLNTKQPWAEAVAIQDGKIAYVGSNEGVESLIGAKTEVIELNGRMLLPGFHDAHVHPLEVGTALITCNLFGLESQEAYLKQIKECTQAQADKKIVVGVGYGLFAFPDGMASKADLDAIVPDRPAAFMDSDGHSIWANSRMLELTDIDKKTPDPAGGRIVRDPKTGEATGLLLDDAIHLVTPIAFAFEPPQIMEAFKKAIEQMNRVGITSFVEAQAVDKSSAERVNKLVTELEKAGFQIHMHTVGDKAVRMGLDALQAARQSNQRRDTRHCLSHLYLIAPDDIPRFKELDVVANMQAYWAAPHEYQWHGNQPILELTRFMTLFPFRSLAGAYFMRQEEITGSIEVGKYADLVVLDQNLFDIPANQIAETQVLMTLLEGQEMYRREGF